LHQDDESKRTIVQLAREVGRYLLVGFSSAGLELLLFMLMQSWMKVDVIIANPVAVTVATAFNFLLNRSFTFKSASNPARSLLLYLLLFAFNQCFTTFTIVLLVDHGLAALPAKLFTMGCVVLWNFALYRKVIFR